MQDIGSITRSLTWPGIARISPARRFYAHFSIYTNCHCPALNAGAAGYARGASSVRSAPDLPCTDAPAPCPVRLPPHPILPAAGTIHHHNARPQAQNASPRNRGQSGRQRLEMQRLWYSCLPLHQWSRAIPAFEQNPRQSQTRPLSRRSPQNTAGVAHSPAHVIAGRHDLELQCADLLVL